MGRCHALLWQCDPSPHPPFPGLCLGGLLDISVDVPWMMIMSCPGLMACGHLSPEVSKSVSYPLGLESGLQPWPLPTPACPASPPSALRLPEFPGALLLEKGPALGEGGTKWVG